MLMLLRDIARAIAALRPPPAHFAADELPALSTPPRRHLRYCRHFDDYSIIFIIDITPLMPCADAATLLHCFHCFHADAMPFRHAAMLPPCSCHYCRFDAAAMIFRRRYFDYAADAAMPPFAITPFSPLMPVFFRHAADAATPRRLCRCHVYFRRLRFLHFAMSAILMPPPEYAALSPAVCLARHADACCRCICLCRHFAAAAAILCHNDGAPPLRADAMLVCADAPAT
jgi:hypothetical protein